MKEQREIITAKEASARFGCSHGQMLRMLGDGLIPSWRTGPHPNARRFLYADELEAYRLANMTQPTDTISLREPANTGLVWRPGFKLAEHIGVGR